MFSIFTWMVTKTRPVLVSPLLIQEAILVESPHWPFTVTVTRPSSSPAISAVTWQARRSLPVPWRNWVSGRSSPGRPRPRAGWSGQQPTFQDRSGNRVRLAGAATIDEANEVLSSFLPRFNERFGVPAEQDCAAYRPVEHWVSLEQTLCFKYPRKVARDNTLKYHRRTLQLLPDGTRPSYAGLQVEVQEDLEGRLLVQYLGQTIPNQEAPPRPSLLKTTNSRPSR